VKEYDLIVIGGGPAGLSASITASRQGSRTLLLERRKLPRHKVCGEFISAETLTLLSHLLSPGFSDCLAKAPRIHSARLFVDASTLEAKIDPPAASISRFELDAALWESAIYAGVDARQNVTVKAVDGSGPFEVFASAGQFKARSVIDASGRHSNLKVTDENRAKLPRQKWIGLKAHFVDSQPCSTSNTPLSVDLYFFSGGYCGVQPLTSPDLNTRAQLVNACAMVRADIATSLPEVLRCHPRLLERSANWTQAFDTLATAHLLFGRPRPVSKRVLAAGDAVAFVDPFVGDGISLALRSGSLAAECLKLFIAGQESLDQGLQRYRELYDVQLSRVFRAASTIRRLLALPRPVRKTLVHAFGRMPALTRYLVQKTR
jgi:menaquinone-9 beta-reductase